jgi:hypothetical protein
MSDVAPVPYHASGAATATAAVLLHHGLHDPARPVKVLTGDLEALIRRCPDCEEDDVFIWDIPDGVGKYLRARQREAKIEVYGREAKADSERMSFGAFVERLRSGEPCIVTASDRDEAARSPRAAFRDPRAKTVLCVGYEPEGEDGYLLTHDGHGQEQPVKLGWGSHVNLVFTFITPKRQ